MASELDLDAYLARIGERAPLAPAVDGLASLHRAHCAAIPFENLDPLLGRAIALDLPALEPQLPRGLRDGQPLHQHVPSLALPPDLVGQRSRPEKRAFLRNRDLVVREDGASTTEAVRDPEHLLEVLDGVFGLAFPPGTRFRQPEL